MVDERGRVVFAAECAMSCERPRQRALSPVRNSVSLRAKALHPQRTGDRTGADSKRPIAIQGLCTLAGITGTRSAPHTVNARDAAESQVSADD